MMALTRVPKLTYSQQRTLVETLGSATAVYENRHNILDIIPNAIPALKDNLLLMDANLERCEEEISWAENYRVQCIHFHDNRYPARLKECDDAPMVLYYRGNADLNNMRIVSIVGTRKITDYGRQISEQFVRELAELYNVSRSVINAVVVDLETNGYIMIVPTKWIEVADWENEGNLSILSDLVQFGMLNMKQLQDLLEARKFLELECVRKAAENATKEQLGRLRALLIEEETEDDPKKRARYDLLFHYAICKLSGNMVYGFIMKAFEASAIPLIETFYSDHEVYAFVLDKHQCIANAIADKDGIKAEHEMRLLLEHGETIIRKLTKKKEEI